MPENNTFVQSENQTLPEPTKRLDEVKEVKDSWVAPKLGTPEEQRAAFNESESGVLVDNAFKSINSENEQLLSQGLIARADANPARYLHASKTAEAMGVDDVNLVYDNLDEFEQRRKSQEKERYIRRCDNLKDMCIDDPTLLAKLDNVSAGQLKRINDNLVIYGGIDSKSGLSGKWARAKYTFNKAEQDFEVNELGYDIIGTTGIERAEKIQFLREAEERLDDMPELDTSGWSVGDLTLNAIEQLPYQMRTTGAMIGGTLAGAAAGSVASPAGSVAAGYAGNIAGRAIALYEGYKAESGSIMRELLKVQDADGKPLDDDIVDVASRFYGGFSSAIEQIGAEKMMKAMGLGNITKIGLKNAIKEAVKDKTKRGIFVKIAKDFVGAISSEGAEEFMQQLLASGVERTAQDFARLYRGDNYEADNFIDGLIDDLGEAAEAGIQGVKASIVMAGAPSAARTAHASVIEYKKSHSKVKETKAKADIQILDNVQKEVQAYAESEGYEPKTVGALFQRAKRQSIYQDIFVNVDDAKALMQTDAMQANKEVLTQNGLWADMERQISAGEELGTPVRIGFADFGEKVMPSPELYAAWKEVIKTYEDGVTLKEIKASQTARANWLAEGQKRAANKDANFEYAYKAVMENAVYANMPELQRKQQAELAAGLLTYMAEQTNTNIQEFVKLHLPRFELSLNGEVSGNANVKDIIAAVRDEAVANETQNLINVSKRVARKDINAIKKLLLSKINNPNTADVKKYVQIVNAISDMKLNIEGMSDEDIINHLAEYTKSGELTLDIKRNDADRVKSGLYSASETALADIQANTGGGDYVLVGGGRVPVNYEIVELNDMITSHNDAGAVNENYPQELQPRDRSRTASDVQITNIVKNFAPERVAKAEIATEGAPIVTQQGFVAVGNGRAMAIRQVYNNDATAQTYKDYLTSKGFDLTGFDKPVLVRRLAMNMSNEQLRALVDDANTAGTMQYSDSENALRDAAKMTGNLIDLLDIDADIDSAANKRFLTGFFSEVVPTAERNAYLDKDDKITRKGVERVENALVAKLLPDVRFLSVLVENPDNNIRKVTRSLAKAAPAIIGFENDIAAGRTSADYSIAGDVSGAVEILKRAKDRGVSAGDFIKMTDMFADPIEASTQAMVQLFENTTGASDFMNKILNYIHNANEFGDLEQGSMFAVETMTKLQLLEREAAQQSLFQFAGANALTADMISLEQAKDMAKVGYDAELIRGQTGWFKGADSKWRFEISDKDAKVNRDVLENITSLDNLRAKREQLMRDIKAFEKEKETRAELYADGYLDELISKRYDEVEKIDYDIDHGYVSEPKTTLGELLRHDKLYAAYPSLKNITVIIRTSKDLSAGSYSRSENAIYLDSRLQDNEIKSTLMHEIQHIIQSKENFSRGGNMEMANAYRKIIKSKEAKDFHKALERKVTEAMVEQLRADNLTQETANEIADAYGKYLNAIFDDSLENEKITKIEQDYYQLLGKLGIDSERVENAYKAIQGRDLWQEAVDETKSKLSDANAYEIYKAFAGEVEARNTQARMEMSDEERASTSPESTQDVKNADALVVFPDGSEAAYIPENGRNNDNTVDLAQHIEKVDADRLAFERKDINPELKGREKEIVKAVKINRFFNDRSKSKDISIADVLAEIDKTVTKNKNGVRVLKNSVTGETVTLSKNSINKMFNTASMPSNENVGGILGKECIANIGKIFDNALLIKTHEDTKHGTKNKIRRYANAITSDGETFIVKLTVKELAGGRKDLTDVEIEGNNGKNLAAYDLKVGRKNAAGNPLGSLAAGANATVAHNSGNDISIDNLIAFVNSYSAESIKIDGKERPVRNSTGKRIAKTEEGLRAFYKWFGDSKAVDADGKPLVVYHGTREKFAVFDIEKAHDGQYKKGFFFTADKAAARMYGDIIMPVYLKAETDFYKSKKTGKPIDYIHPKNDSRDIWIVFDNKQIKSVKNRGSFSGDTGNIYYQHSTKISEEQLEADLAEFDKILDSFHNENKGYYDKKSKFDAVRKVQKKYQDFFMYNIAEASSHNGQHDLFFFEYDGKKDIRNMWLPKKLEKNSSVILYRNAEQIIIPVSEFDENKFKKLGYKRQKKFYEGMRDIYTLDKSVKSDRVYYQSAFAGSRVDYDKPSLEAIGTGEGAQAHGWGLYYALNKDVAEKYRKSFTLSNVKELYKGKNVVDWYDEDVIIYSALRKIIDNGMDKDEAISYQEMLIDRYSDESAQYFDADILAEQKEILQKIKEINVDDIVIEKPTGQVHEVDIPENPYLLDEQKGYNEQSDIVKQVLDKINKDFGIAINDTVTYGEKSHTITGRYIYNHLADKLGSSANASAYLSENGIKGITYDGRQDGRCFVIFNPADVRVIQKFYQDFGNDALGAYIPLERKIVLFRNHNLSTIIHETGHWWLDTLQQVAQSEKASDKLKADWQTIKDWLGVAEDNIISEEQHEKFARGVEAYFMTKKAPSSRLAELFDTFRRWLTSVYKDIKELDVNLNDDVVRVFNHMLASEAEIEEYRQANNLKEMFDRADVFGLSPKDFEKYKELAENSMTLAKNRHFNDKMLLIYREEQEAYNELKKRLANRVRDEWCRDKYNRAIYAIYRGKVGDIDIGKISLNEAQMRELFGDNLQYLQKRDGEAIYSPEGLDLQTVADMVGLSVDELKGTLLSVRNRTRKYKELLDRRVHEELGDPVSYDDVQKQVVSSIYNDKQANLLHFELNTIGKTLGKKSVLEQGYETYARNKIENMRIKDLKPQAYAEQAQKAGDKALQAMERGNRDAAYRYKEMQIRNFYLYREAQKQYDVVEKNVKRLKQIGKKEVNIGVEQTYQDAARALLSKVDLARTLNSKQQERLGDLAIWVMEQRRNGYEIIIPDKFLHEINRVNYAELTVDDFISLSDSVKSLIHNGRDIKEFELAGQLVDREKLLAEMNIALKKHGVIEKTASSRKSAKETAAKFWRGLDSFLTGLGFIANRIDNGDTNGIFHKTFLRPLSDAQTLENDLQVKYANKITALTVGLSKETKVRMREFVPEAEKILNGKYTLEDLITIGLNMGNRDNLQRLQDGNNFSKNQLNWVKNYLTQEHWDYIQAIWDVLESMYPMLEEHHKKMSGLDMDKVFPVPVQTNYGTYRGGYFPIVYDREFSPEMEIKAALFDADYNVATTSKGYTKKRVNAVNAPIKLGLMNVAQHMNTVLHDVAYRGTLRKLWTLANNPEFVEMFDNTIGKEYRDSINELLKTLGNEPNRETRGLAAWEKCLRFMRQRATLVGLGFRLTTALSQPLGFFASIATMTEHKQKQGGKHGGAYYVALGHKELLTNPKIYDWAMASSGELRARLGNQDASIAKRIKELTKNAGNMTFKEQAEAWAYKAIGYMDFYVANVTWIGAYRQATNEFKMKHKDAVFYADRVMLNSQGAGTTKDTAGVQRANEGWRALTMFYSFFSALYQTSIQFGRDVKQAKSFEEYADLSARFMAMFVIPACLDSLMRGEAPDGDDESLLAWLFDNTFGYFIGGVPVARDIYSSFKYEISGSSSIGRQANYFGNFYSGVAKAFDGDPNWQKISKNAMNAFAVATGYPTGGQVADSASYFVGVAAGEIKPQSLTDILWGIYKGKERK